MPRRRRYAAPSVPSTTSAQRTARRKAEQRELTQKKTRRRLLAEARAEAREFGEGMRSDVDPADAVQQILDELTGAWQYATQKALTLEEGEYFQQAMGTSVPHPWIREQERLGLQVVHVAAKAANMGLAERSVRLQEQQAAIFATVLEGVLTAMGIGMEQRRAIHTQISDRLEQLESGDTTELAPVLWQ